MGGLVQKLVVMDPRVRKSWIRNRELGFKKRDLKMSKNECIFSKRKK